jgi:hypothetical protein
MALAPIAPWIVPPDYTKVMEAGASLGATLREQDIKASESADRLQSAYGQLAMKEQYMNEIAQAKLKQSQAESDYKHQAAANALAFRYQQAQDKQAYESARLQQFGEGLGLRQQNLQLATEKMKDLEGYRAEKMARDQELLDLKKMGIHQGPRGSFYQVTADGVKTIREPDPIPAKKAIYHMPVGGDPMNIVSGTADDPMIAQLLKEASAKAMAKKKAATDWSWNPLHPLTFGPSAPPEVPPQTTESPALRAAKKDTEKAAEDEARAAEAEGQAPAAAALVGPPGGGGPAAPTASPFKEGQFVRNKKSGKWFQVRNGVPVEIEGEPPAQ